MPLLSDHMRNQLSARDQRMAKTICTICMSYLVCNLPIITLKFISGNDNNDIPHIRLVISLLFWLQYSLNFVLYAASNKQYREVATTHQ